MRHCLTVTAVLCGVILPRVAVAQVDSARADAFFAEARAVCQADDGALWGVSLCGPMVFADAATGTIATNQPPPDAPRPRILGYANAAWRWGDERWSTFVWAMVPDDPQRRRRMFAHELFHRVQPELDLFDPGAPPADHLDTMAGRVWIQLEWRALAAALRATGAARERAIADALAFRTARRAGDSTITAVERASELNEGLAQYTGTRLATASPAAAIADALEQLDEVTGQSTFVRTFAYPSGTAYGLLLDASAPGWNRRFTKGDDLGATLAAAAGVSAATDLEAAVSRHGGAALRASEAARERTRLARVDSLTARFVTGPVLVVPRGSGASFRTDGVTPLPGVGTVVPHYRVSGPWGSLEAEQVLLSGDGARLTLPGPVGVSGRVLSGAGWTVTLAEGWVARPGPREGDLTVVRDEG
ncbi:MAG TPA: hypothetical protein PLI93_03145 [Gemmatimonadales bacterium]|nr:hypothetical protein [Gemmatimonadales bacterium]